MNNKIIYLGNKYWADNIIDDIIGNDFDFKKEVKETIVKKESLCQCGRYGTMIIFQWGGQLYSFNYLTGYPCEC